MIGYLFNQSDKVNVIFSANQNPVNHLMARQHRVLVTRMIPSVVEHLKSLSVHVDCYDRDDKVMPRDELLRRVAGCDGIFCLLTENIDKQVLDAAGTSLKVVSTMSVGYNHINIQECARRGIKVGYTPGVLDISTAETAVSLTFAAKRRLVECSLNAKEGKWGVWQPYQFCGTDITGSTIGIIGLGRIGATYARMMRQAFNCRILYTSRRPHPQEADPLDATYCSLEDLLSQSDIVSVHCALTDETKHLLSSKEFKTMKPTSVLINTSRGGVIDQEALYQALVEKEIAAAGLDVTDPEPLSPTHQLFTLPNCTIMPHIGSATIATRNKMASLALQNLLAGIKGSGSLPFEVKELERRPDNANIRK